MLTILSDPAGITGRRRIPWDGRTVLEQIAEAMPDGGEGCTVRINGIEVDPLADPRMGAPPREADDVVVVQRPEGVAEAFFVASLILAAYTYSLIPKPVDQPTQSTSPNNQLTGQTNVARAYQAIPDVYGLRRVWPDLIQPSTVEYVNNVKRVTEWLCVSRGKGTITDVQYAETPIDDIAGASWQPFEPAASPNTYREDNDTTLTDVYEAFESPEVNGQEIADAPGFFFHQGTVETTNGSASFTIEFTTALATLDPLKASATAVINMDLPDQPAAFVDALCTVDSYVETPGVSITFTFIRQAGVLSVDGTYTFTPVRIEPSAGGTAIGPFTLPVDAQHIWCNFAFLRGLVGTVQVRADWWAIDSSGAMIAGTDDDTTFTFNKDTYDQQFFSERITPAAGLRRYRVLFTRLTADLGNGADVCKIEEVFAVRYYATKVLPGVTVIKVTTNATAQAIGFQDRKFNLRWTRHVRTLSSTTVSASRNFARALVHQWAIAGNDVAEIDTSTIGAVNTALGEDSELSRFDWSFDDANMSIGERLQIIANVARCVMWRDGTQWTLTRDQARTTPEMQLDYRNLAAGGESGINYAAHLPASEDGIELEYVDETTQATKAYVRLTVASGSVAVGVSAHPKKIKLVGCATAAQALNRAKLEAGKLLYQRTSVSDSALAEAATRGPGSLVRWIDPNDFAGDDGLQAGEVLSIAGSVIRTSEDLDFGVETSGRMLFTGVDGLHLNAGVPIVVTPAPGGAVLASVPSGLYVRDDTRQLGSRYAFAVGLTAAEVEAAGLFTITDIRPGSDRTVQLSMVNYDGRIYAGDFSVAIGLASETSTAQAIASNIRAVLTATESDAAQPMTVYLPPVLGLAEEVDEARPIPSSLANVWNPSDKDADISLSAANATASITSPATGAVRAVTGQDASGDHYFEVTVGGTDGRSMVGIGLSSATLGNYPGFDANGRGYWGDSGQKYVSGSGASYGATFGAGAVIGVRLNGGTLTFYVNGSSQGSAYTGLTGTYYPMWSGETAVAGTRTGTINTGREAFLSLPSGSTAWG